MTLDAAAFGKPVGRLGLASHGATQITTDDVMVAIERGVRFLNWPGEAEKTDGRDAFSDAIASLGKARDEVVVCVQFGARTASDAASELRSILRTLATGYIDVLTLYYVEHEDEWRELTSPQGGLTYLLDAKRAGAVRQIGLTSHQRPLAAAAAQSGLLDMLMIRYNAAHRGAERDVFPVTDALGMPVVAYTALRWGALLRPTRDDPQGFVAPPATDWYQFVLQTRSVAVALAAPHDRAEMDADLEVLCATGPLSESRYDALTAHGERVRRHAGTFP